MLIQSPGEFTAQGLERKMEIVRILAVDDHEMTTLGYKFILEDTDFEGFKVSNGDGQVI